MSFIRFQEMGKIKFENRLLVLQNSHTYSAQKLGHTHSAQKLQKTRKNRNRITSIAVSSWCHRLANLIHIVIHDTLDMVECNLVYIYYHSKGAFTN